MQAARVWWESFLSFFVRLVWPLALIISAGPAFAFRWLTAQSAFGERILNWLCTPVTWLEQLGPLNVGQEIVRWNRLTWVSPAGVLLMASVGAVALAAPLSLLRPRWRVSAVDEIRAVRILVLLSGASYGVSVVAPPDFFYQGTTGSSGLLQQAQFIAQLPSLLLLILTSAPLPLGTESLAASYNVELTAKLGWMPGPLSCAFLVSWGLGKFRQAMPPEQGTQPQRSEA